MHTKILIADDHKIIREGLRSLIENQPNMEVVGETEDGRTTVQFVRKFTPDVVVMDMLKREFVDRYGILPKGNVF